MLKKAKTIQIIIEFKELIFFPNEELLIEALRSLSRIFLDKSSFET